MRNFRCFGKAVPGVLAFLVAGSMAILAQSPRSTQSFDEGWRFLQADASQASTSEFDDASWTTVRVPHDWAIAGPFARENPSGGAGAFAPAGVGWYRKHFRLPAKESGKRVFVEFDGIMANSDVWINGVLLGHRPYGYVSLRYELTDHLHFGPAMENVIAVRADNSKQPSSRWFEGAGIYRHVRLVVEEPVHTAALSTFVTTPSISDRSAEVRVQTAVLNQAKGAAEVSVQATVTGPGGKVFTTPKSAGKRVEPGGQASFDLSGMVRDPQRWDLEHPALYRLRLDVFANGRLTDSEAVTFGIREFHFDPNTGFWLNGRNLKIKGVALHADGGGLGMAVPLGAWEHRLAAMRQMGANAIRTAHDPVAPEFLDLCDRMGWLVMDEMFDQWTVAKNPYDYHLYFKDWYLTDTRDTVRRDRNHPSIILYSAGNEIHDTPKEELAKSILTPLVQAFHDEDPTRPVTQALFRPNVSHDYQDGLADLLDVVGQNYRPNELLAAHAEKPSRKILGTENIHDRESWLYLRDHPEYSGQFLWAGTDYLGESRHWPIIGDASGLYDRTDAAKPDGLERQSWWSDVPVVHVVRRVAPTQLAPTDPGYEAEQYRPKQVLFADWSPADRKPHNEQVEVYSNCAEVELFVNGRSLGTQGLNADASARKWTVPFSAGGVKAVERNGAKACAEEELRSAGEAARLKLSVERARLSSDWDDVAYVRATVTDAAGVAVPDSAARLHFSVEGPGQILATDNADNADTSGFQRPDRAAFRGSAIVILRATAASGAVHVKVSADGLTGDEVTLPIAKPR